MPQGLSRGGCLHEGFADEESAESSLAEPTDGAGTGDAALGDFHHVGRQCFDEPERMGRIGMERAEVAGVDSHYINVFA